MCWLDKVAVRNFLKLREEFGIRDFVETGTAEGNTAIFYARHFENVHSCEADEQRFAAAKARTRHLPNVSLHLASSPDFLRAWRRRHRRSPSPGIPLFFLDAHSPENWPVLRELAALRRFGECCVVIHDFKVPDRRLGFIKYGSQALDLDYVEDELFGVNPRFVLYHNTRAMSEIWTPEEREKGVAALPWDDATRWALDYAWSEPRKTYRGILYAVPRPLDSLEAKRWT